MKWLITVALVLVCMTFFAGCQNDEKQSVNIQDKMRESAAYEKEFVSKQDDLKEYREKGQSIYNDLIDLDIQKDNDTYQQKVENANTMLKKQKATLEKGEKNYQQAYTKSSSIKTNIEEIKDDKQKEKAFDLLAIMKERQKHITTFFSSYKNQIKRLHSFYHQLEGDTFRIDKLEDDIQEINDYDQDMEDMIHAFNQDTKKYNKAEKNYYKAAELNEKG